MPNNILQCSSWPIEEKNGVNTTILELLETHQYKNSLLLTPKLKEPDLWLLRQNGKVVDSIKFTPIRRKSFGLLDTIMRLLFQPIAFYRLIKLFRKYNIGVFHLHFLSHFCYIFTPICKFLKVKFFISLHGSDIYRPQKSFIYNISRRLAIKYAQFFSCSAALKAESLKLLKINESRVQVIHHGFPSQAVTFQNKPKIENLIVAVGRLDPVKGFDLLIEAAYILKKQYQQSFQLQIIGGGAEYDSLQKQINEHGLNDCVELTGEKSSIEVYKSLSESSIFVLSSRFEALPISILEALYYKNLVIATDVGGVKEIINEDIGILIPANNPEIIADKLMYSLQNPDQAKSMANKSYAYCMENFNWNKAASQYIEAYLHEDKK